MFFGSSFDLTPGFMWKLVLNSVYFGFHCFLALVDLVLNLLADWSLHLGPILLNLQWALQLTFLKQCIHQSFMLFNRDRVLLNHMKPLLFFLNTRDQFLQLNLTSLFNFPHTLCARFLNFSLPVLKLQGCLSFQILKFQLFFIYQQAPLVPDSWHVPFHMLYNAYL